MPALNRKTSYKWFFVSSCLVALLVHSYFAFKEVVNVGGLNEVAATQSQVLATLLDRARDLPQVQYDGLLANHSGILECQRMTISLYYGNNSWSTTCYPKDPVQFERGFPRVLGGGTCRRWLASFMSLCCLIVLGLHAMHGCRSIKIFRGGGEQKCFPPCAHLCAVFDDLRKRCKSCACYDLHQGDGQVRDEFLKQRCRYASIFVTVVNPIITICFTMSVMNLNRRYWLENDYDVDLGQLLIGSEIMPLCFACFIFFNLKCAHPLPTPESLNRANVLLSGMWIWRYATLPWEFYYRFAPIIWVARLIQGIAFGNFRLSCGLHIIVSLADIFVFAAHRGIFHTFYTTLARVPEEESGYALSQLLVILLVFALTFSFECVLSAQAKAIVEANRSNISHILVHRLLSAMCDCIVHLDSDLCIAKECPQLAGFLLHRSTSRTYIGQHFAMFLREPDRERFNNHMQEELSLQETLHGNVSSHPGPHPLHVQLIDAGGTLVSIEAFCSIFKDADGNCSCLVGIKEDADPSLWRQSGQASLVDGVLPKRDLTARVFDPIDERSCSQTSAEDDSSMVDIDDDLNHSAAVVWIRAETDSWEILRCNSMFTIFTPQVVRRSDSLRTWVADQKSRDRLKDAIKKSEANATNITRIKLRPPGYSTQRIMLVDCSVERIQDELRLVFSHFRSGKEKHRHECPSRNSARPISL